MLEDSKGDVHRFRAAEEACSPNGFKTDSRVFIFCQCSELRQRIRSAVTPVAENASGGRARMRVLGSQHTFEQFSVWNIVPGVHPKGLSQIVLVIRVTRV